MIKRLCLLLCITIAVSVLMGCSGIISGADTPNTFDREKIGAEPIDANTEFAFNIFKQLNKEDINDNVFISPLSISAALTMVWQGAGTSTKEAMTAALSYKGIEQEKVNESYRNLLPYLEQLDKKIDLNISNSIWLREGVPIKEEFLSVNKTVFDAGIFTMDFSKPDAPDQINKWISDATKKKIDKMVDAPIPDEIFMYLINAIYFKGDWTTQFDKKNTKDKTFKSLDNDEYNVKMMSMSGKIGFVQGDSYKAVRLPYGSGKSAMYCILPKEETSINDFIANLDPETWDTIRDSISEKPDVRLQLPRFKIEYGIKNLNRSLSAMGMGEAFTDKADFSGIRDNVCINRVLHKAVIEVDEQGSEAAAVTVVEARTTSYSEPLTFIADRPFIFLIADDVTGTILFMGKVIDVK